MRRAIRKQYYLCIIFQDSRIALSFLIYSEDVFMKNTVFEGVATALITPMLADGSIDYEAFGRIIDWQIEQGVNAIVSVGTTGEGSTLDDAEHKAAMKFTVDRVAGRVPVIAGTGSNDTAYGIQLQGLRRQINETLYSLQCTLENRLQSFT